MEFGMVINLKDRFEEWKDDFLRFLDKIFSIPYYQVTTGIRNIFYWLPVIWKDRDWDSHHLYKVMEHKIRSMDRYLNSNQVHCLHSDNTLKKLRICLHLLERITEDYYLDLARSEFRPYQFTGDIFEGAARLENGNLQLRSMTDEERKCFLKYNDHCHYLELQDLSMLCRLLEKYSKYWWD